MNTYSITTYQDTTAHIIVHAPSMRHVQRAINKGAMCDGSGRRRVTSSCIHIAHCETLNTSPDLIVNPDGTFKWLRQNWAGQFGKPVGTKGRIQSTDDPKFRKNYGFSCVYRLAV